MRHTRSMPLLAAITLTVFCGSVNAKTECDEDLTKPGACFFPAATGSVVVICDDGLIAWGPGSGDAKRQTGRVNPNGAIAVHQSDGMLSGGACRTEDFSICGTVFAPTEAVFLGVTNFQVNGFITPLGGASCPFKATAKGSLYRDVGYGPEEVEIDFVLHNVKDKESVTGCRMQQCRIFAPDSQ